MAMAQAQAQTRFRGYTHREPERVVAEPERVAADELARHERAKESLLSFTHLVLKFSTAILVSLITLAFTKGILPVEAALCSINLLCFLHCLVLCFILYLSTPVERFSTVNFTVLAVYMAIIIATTAIATFFRIESPDQASAPTHP